MNDTLQKFLFEQLNIRGERVLLDATWRTALERSEYPAPVRHVLGESMVAAALLSATIKFEGSITLQVQGDGPISMLVVQASAGRTLRGMAHWEGTVPEAGALRDCFGDARLVITIETGRDRERYQGIVELEGDSVAEALERYLERSEQLPTRLWLTADPERAAGLLVQKLPGPETDRDAWDRISALAETVTEQELVALPTGELLYRLFHEEDIRLFEPEPVAFRCSCSRERISDALRGLGRTEVEEILAEEGAIVAHCDFCNQRYEFDSVDAEQLLTEQPQPAVKPTRH